MKKKHVTWQEIQSRLDLIDKEGVKVFGIPRGGAIVACLLRKATRVESHEEASLILDDICDTGETRNKYHLLTHGKPFFAVVDKLLVEEHKDWPHIQFPWENENEDEEFNDILKKTLTRCSEMYAQYVDPGTLRAMKEAYRQHTKGSAVVASMMIAQSLLALGPVAAEYGYSLGEAAVQGILKYQSFTEIQEGAE